MTKICTGCKQEKLLDDFRLAKLRGKLKRRSKCKSCEKEYNKKYIQLQLKDNPNYHKEQRSKYKDFYTEYSKKYREEHYNKITEYSKKYNKEYHEQNKKIQNKKARDYYLNNKSKILKQKKSKNHIVAERRKFRYHNDENFKIRHLLRTRFGCALKHNSKKSSVLQLLGCSIEQLKQHLEKQFTEGMSWDNHGEWHIDHIKPCSSFDLTKESEQHKCFHFSNIQPLWAEDNHKKYNKVA